MSQYALKAAMGPGPSGSIVYTPSPVLWPLARMTRQLALVRHAMVRQICPAPHCTPQPPQLAVLLEMSRHAVLLLQHAWLVVQQTPAHAASPAPQVKQS